MRTPARPGAPVAVLLLVLALLVGACSGDKDAPAAPEAGASSSGSSPTAGPDRGPKPLRTRVTLGVLTGKLGAKAKRHLKRSVTAVVDDWIDAAYVDGDYPRGNFKKSFPHFTSGARDQARHDRDLMTNQDIGKRIDGVSATRRRLRVDAVVARHRPVGATARFVLHLRTTGDLERRVAVGGRLFLTRQHGWRVFGYDVHKGALK